MDSQIISGSNYINLYFSLDNFGFGGDDAIEAANMIMKKIRKKLEEDFLSLLEDLKMGCTENPDGIMLMYPNTSENCQRIKLLEYYIGHTKSIVDFYW
jgi:hypothetical protein